MTKAESCGESTEVSWPLGATTTYATLALPPGPGPFPGVVMVAGSGPTDRDWNSPLIPGENGSARLLAEELACAGLASIRYDKRASGPHARENMQHFVGRLSMQSHVDEFAGAVRTLAEAPFVREDRIFALANSEGNLHALNYQLRAPAIPLAGLVLTAPPGRAIGALARSQLTRQFGALPEPELLLSLYDAAVSRFLAAEAAEPDPRLPAAAQMLLRGLETPANLPFARELWFADAAPLLGEIDVPALVVIGKKDIQVDWRADGDPLERAATRHDVTFLYPENANHVLKHEPRARAELSAADVQSRYNAPDAGLDRDTVTAIVEWARAHV
jgi:uncharacterized protein